MVPNPLPSRLTSPRRTSGPFRGNQLNLHCLPVKLLMIFSIFWRCYPPYRLRVPSPYTEENGKDRSKACNLQSRYTGFVWAKWANMAWKIFTDLIYAMMLLTTICNLWLPTYHKICQKTAMMKRRRPQDENAAPTKTSRFSFCCPWFFVTTAYHHLACALSLILWDSCFQFLLHTLVLCKQLHSNHYFIAEIRYCWDL